MKVLIFTEFGGDLDIMLPLLESVFVDNVNGRDRNRLRIALTLTSGIDYSEFLAAEALLKRSIPTLKMDIVASDPVTLNERKFQRIGEVGISKQATIDAGFDTGQGFLIRRGNVARENFTELNTSWDLEGGNADVFLVDEDMQEHIVTRGIGKQVLKDYGIAERDLFQSSNNKVNEILTKATIQEVDAVVII